MLWFLVSSPAQYEKVGRDWDKFASAPAGTGPFRLDRLVPRGRAELVKNPDYWDKHRIPKVDRLVLVPIPEALTRPNALLARQGGPNPKPPPDVLPRLKQARMETVTHREP